MDTPDDTDRDLPPNPRQPFGTWLRLCREQVGLTRKQLAEVAKMGELGLRDVELLRYPPTAAERRRLVDAVAAVDAELGKTSTETA